MRGIRIVLLAAACAATGCVPPPTPPAPSGPEPTTPATEEECRAVAVELERAVRSGDPSEAIQAFALEVIAHRVVAGLPVAEDLKAELLKLVPVRADTNALIKRILTEVGSGGQFKLLRVTQADAGYKATFRITRENFWVQYMDVTVARFPGGRLGVEELVCLNDGDQLTKLVRWEILPAAALRDPSLEARVSDEDRLYLANSQKVRALYDAFGDRKWQEVVTLYKGLPAGLQDHRPLHFMNAHACVKGKMKEAKATLDTCRRRFPGDPAVDMLALDYHAFRDEYAAATRALKALRAWGGEDTFLDVSQAMILTDTGKLGAARATAEKAVAADPEFKMAYLTRVVIAAKVHDHADTLAWLKKTVECTGYDFGDLRQGRAFASFVESPEFRQWLAWRATRGEQ